MLVEEVAVDVGRLPIVKLREHLRIGAGFVADEAQDDLLETCLRAALEVIEGRTGKAVFRRDFSWSVHAWRDLARQVLPIAPVTAIRELAIVDFEDVARVIGADRYRLIVDAHRPAIAARSLVLPSIPVGGLARIGFEAGYGASWSDIPADLRRATLMLAASFYENRFEPEAGSSVMPHGVTALLERYRHMRLFSRRGA